MATYGTVYQLVFKIWASIAAGPEPSRVKIMRLRMLKGIVSLAIDKTAAPQH
jgi:hypothetical protein